MILNYYIVIVLNFKINTKALNATPCIKLCLIREHIFNNIKFVYNVKKIIKSKLQNIFNLLQKNFLILFRFY